VALIAGPTASGKTGLAIRLANHNIIQQKYVIINADSAQIYRSLPILSAHPSAEEMQQAEHKLFGYLDGDTPYSAASWAIDAKKEIAQAHEDNKVPILVGGTGLYIRTLLEGIAPIPNIDPAMRKEIRNMSTENAYNALEQYDQIMADKLHPSDTSRIMRALEVIKSTGKSIDVWRKNKSGGIIDEINLKALLLLPPREWLYHRCNRRFTEMLKNGAIEEVEDLIKKKTVADSPLWRTIGVNEIKSYLQGDISIDQAINLGQIATRQYAKRQYTWFRNQTSDKWSRAETDINYKNINHFVTLLH